MGVLAMKISEYLLICLQEEAAEVIKAASKCQRFGLEDAHPDRGVSNLYELQVEINDLFVIISLLNKEGFELYHEEKMMSIKQEKMKHWIEYSTRKGIIDG
jgi:NTP pyrophosphatase (non-canonical NTP hydrolase)